MIGKRCKNVAPDSYLDMVVAYTIMNDVSMRDIPDEGDEAQHHADGQEPRTTAPTGPYLVTRDEIADPQNLQISTFVNGERRQFAKRTK